MTSPHDSGLNELLFEYLESDSEDPGAELEALCRAHPEHAAMLRRRVATLVDMGLAGEADSDTEDHIPKQLGDFHIRRRLGAGGMGVVYLAHQESLDREVALKLVRPEQLYFEGARERFRREVTTVGRLSHPGIVPVYAVGEDLGIPYFAMEHIQGATLGEILQQVARSSTIDKLTGADFDRALEELGAPPASGETTLFLGTWEEACLRVLREVAEALEHAHRSGVLHRDIKPTNVMITRGGRVMLVDFGLSSDENASERITRSGSQVGSLPYMAPEIIHGTDRPSVASDVYALGATLYEMLTLKLPFEGHTHAALSENLRTTSAVAPRSLNPALSWEAETISLVAIDRQPERRYVSAGALAHDLSNALEHKPILAQPPGRLLRLRRWSERHPAQAVSLMAGFLLVVVAPSLFAWQLYRSSQVLAGALTRAETNFSTAIGAINKMLVRMSSERLVDLPHMVDVRREILEEAQDLYEGFIEEHADDPALARELATARFELATVFERLGDEPRAMASLEQGIAEMEVCAENDPEDLRLRLALISLKKDYAHLLDRAIRFEDAERAIRESLAICDEIEPRVQDRAEFAMRKAHSLGVLIDILRSGDRVDESVDVAHEAVALMAPYEDHPDIEVGRAFAMVLRRMATCLASTKPDEADGFLMDAIDAIRSLADEHPTSTNFAWDLATMLQEFGYGLARKGEFDEALELDLEAESILVQLNEDYPKVPLYIRKLAEVWSDLGVLYENLDESDKAIANYTKATPLLEEVARQRPDAIEAADNLITNLASLALHLAPSGAYAEALPYFDRGIELSLELTPKLPERYVHSHEFRLTFIRQGRAETLAHLNRHAECAAEVDEMLALRPEAPDTLYMGAATIAVLSRELGLTEPADDALVELYTARAFELLDASVEAGFLDLETLESSQEFAHLREHASFALARERIAEKSR